ncbi:hypothetical protein JY651_32165 [Pyxidicoccus parkwayensis]|uniref:Uncharacterized protein n=1 Tax=Pyxidicoccus parkwayensis TaxID=2813578 RepID=A0ABX7NM50_9BACT|nr:hypothetical protein [Pyxidicoccus parkwaysis]QSQ19919.1 hypothetical protein JY651_32165 [Pyxidicoccus parkwaysis]
MAINLADLREAVRNYLSTQVECMVTSIVPAVPNALSPNERFTFSVQAHNAPAPLGIALRNVRYHVQLTNPSSGRLIVPSRTVATAYPTFDTQSQAPGRAPIPVGTEVTEYFLFTGANSDGARLDVGETDSILNLPGRALALGLLEVRVNIFADPDFGFLFPSNQLSRDGRRSVQVV